VSKQITTQILERARKSIERHTCRQCCFDLGMHLEIERDEEFCDIQFRRGVVRITK
jgi:hypothetical protein